MQRFRSLGFVAALVACGVAATLGGSWALVKIGVDRVLERSAIQAASDWADFFQASGVGFERLATGTPPTVEQLEMIERMGSMTDVFRWQVFDAEGALVFDSRYADALAAGEPLPQEVVLEAERHQQLRGDGAPHAVAERGDGLNAPRRYAETVDELIVDGERVGFLEVSVDQTAEYAELTGEVLLTAISLVVLAVGVSAMPVAGFLWQTRSKESADAARLHAVSHDALTGLLNRAAFARVIDEWCRQPRPHSFYLLAIDVRQFSAFNEEQGHSFGDEVLRQVAQQARHGCGRDVVIARLGADEFAVLSADQGQQVEAVALARRLTAVLCRRFTLEGETVQVAVDVGIAGFPRDGRSAAELLKAAELALRAAKAGEPGGIRTFEPAMEEGRVRRLEIERCLVRAVEEGQFRLAYQPLYRLSDGCLAGFESLLRLDGPDGALITPDEAIPVAEDTKLIIPLSDLILQRACRAAADWPDELFVSVNLSSVDFDRDGPVESVRRALTLADLPARRLEVELTESALAQNPDRVAFKLDRLREMGVRIALDDFGTGYSSLSYVWKFPFHKLKIDRSFVSNLGAEGDRSRQMLRTVVALGEVMGLELIAEGIETDEQADEIRRMRIDYVQGYLFGRPMAEEDVPGFARRRATLAAPARRAEAGR